MHTNSRLQRIAEFVSEHGFGAMVAAGRVVWYVPTSGGGWARCEAATWGQVRMELGY